MFAALPAHQAATAAEGKNDWYGQRRKITRKKRMIRV